MNKQIEKRIKDAVEKAQFEFWAVIAKEFPEVTTGDYPPDATMQFDGECLQAVTKWIEFNGPDQWQLPKLTLTEHRFIVDQLTNAYENFEDDKAFICHLMGTVHNLPLGTAEQLAEIEGPKHFNPGYLMNYLKYYTVIS
jgi:hypothetical protein